MNEKPSDSKVKKPTKGRVLDLEALARLRRDFPPRKADQRAQRRRGPVRRQ